MRQALRGLQADQGGRGSELADHYCARALPFCHPRPKGRALGASWQRCRVHWMRKALAQFIVYNPTRRHSALGYPSPIEYEARAMAEND